MCATSGLLFKLKFCFACKTMLNLFTRTEACCSRCFIFFWISSFWLMQTRLLNTTQRVQFSQEWGLRASLWCEKHWTHFFWCLITLNISPLNAKSEWPITLHKDFIFNSTRKQAASKLLRGKYLLFTLNVSKSWSTVFSLFSSGLNTQAQIFVQKSSFN